MEAPKNAPARRVLDSCRTCTAYVLRPCYVGMKEVRFVAEMGCEKNMAAVTWFGPCDFYQREPGSD